MSSTDAQEPPHRLAIAALRTGAEVVYLERCPIGAPVEHKAQVVVVHLRAHTPPLLDLVCVDRLGRVFARTRVPHESTPGAQAAWRLRT